MKRFTIPVLAGLIAGTAGAWLAPVTSPVLRPRPGASGVAGAAAPEPSVHPPLPPAASGALPSSPPVAAAVPTTPDELVAALKAIRGTDPLLKLAQYIDVIGRAGPELYLGVEKSDPFVDSDPAKFDELLEEIKRGRDDLRLLIVSRWEQLNPGCVAALSERLKDNEELRRLNNDVLFLGLRKESPQRIAAALKAEGGAPRELDLLHVLARGDLEAALSFVSGYPEVVDRLPLLDQAMRKPGDAARLLHSGMNLYGAEGEIWQRWAITDPAAVLSEAGRTGKLPPEAANALAVAIAAAAADGPSALALHKQFPAAKTGQIFGALADRNITVAAEFLRHSEDRSVFFDWYEPPYGSRPDLLRAYLAAGSGEGAAADDLAVIRSLMNYSSSDDGALPGTFLAEAAASGGGSDIAAALRWLEFTDGGPDERTVIATGLGRGLARSVGTAALAEIRAISDESARDAALAGFAEGLVSLDPEAAAEIVGGLPPGAASGIAGKLAAEFASADPAAARQWLAREFESASSESGVANPDVSAIPELMTGDPAGTMRWLQDLNAAGLNTGNALGWAAQNWARMDVIAASAWVDTLQPGPLRNLAISRMVPELAGEDAAAALMWSAGITDTLARRIAGQTSIRHLHPDEARALLNESGMPLEDWEAVMPAYWDPPPASQN